MTDTIEAIDLHRLNKIQRDWGDIVQHMRDAECETPEQAAWWGELLEQAHQHLKELEAERDALVRPQNESVKRTNAAFKAPSTALNEVKALAAAKLAGAALALEGARKAAMVLAAVAAKGGDTDAATAALAAPGDAIKAPHATYTWGWTAAVVDTAALPEAFVDHVPNEKALTDLCKSFKDRNAPPTVAGVVFTRTCKVSPKGSK